MGEERPVEEKSGDVEIDVEAWQAESQLRWAEPQPERAVPTEREVRRGEQQPAAPVERDVRRGMLSASEPRPEERARHELTHTPYAEWCYECVSGRSKDAAHRKAKKTPEGPAHRADGLPSMRTGRPEDNLATLLLACKPGDPITRRGTYGFGRVVQAKGRSDATVLVALNAWFQEAGLNGDIRLRMDGGPAIRAIEQAAAIRRAPAVTLLETSPIGSSDSLGSCERFAETVAGITRTWRLAVEKNLEIEVNANSPIFSWLVRHVVFLYNKCQPHAGGGKAFEHINGHSTSRRCSRSVRP